jgi:hypothetical protein
MGKFQQLILDKKQDYSYAEQTVIKEMYNGGS